MSQEKVTRAHEFAPNYQFVITNFEDKVIDITVLVQTPLVVTKLHSEQMLFVTIQQAANVLLSVTMH